MATSTQAKLALSIPTLDLAAPQKVALTEQQELAQDYVMSYERFLTKHDARSDDNPADNEEVTLVQKARIALKSWIAHPSDQAWNEALQATSLTTIGSPGHHFNCFASHVHAVRWVGCFPRPIRKERQARGLMV